jgi:hypothetical protein
LALFSTDTGDAWLLDPSERFAVRLARDGDPESVHIEDTDTTFSVGGPGITASMARRSHTSTSGRIVTIVGYPHRSDRPTGLIFLGRRAAGVPHWDGSH